MTPYQMGFTAFPFFKGRIPADASRSMCFTRFLLAKFTFRFISFIFRFGRWWRGILRGRRTGSNWLATELHQQFKSLSIAPQHAFFRLFVFFFTIETIHGRMVFPSFVFKIWHLADWREEQRDMGQSRSKHNRVSNKILLLLYLLHFQSRFQTVHLINNLFQITY